jgi:transcriptional regulator with XRE-family HTH domain
MSPETRWGRFDTRALYEALDGQRLARGLTWEQVARETGVASSTLKNTARGGRLEVDGMLRMVGWLDRTVESFVEPGDVVMARRTGERRGASR